MEDTVDSYYGPWAEYDNNTTYSSSDMIYDEKFSKDYWFTDTDSSKIVDGDFCQGPIFVSGYPYSGQIKINNYTPTFKCATKDNYHVAIGLMSYDEVIYAGGYAEKNNTSYYLKDFDTWILNRAGEDPYADIDVNSYIWTLRQGLLHESMQCWSEGYAQIVINLASNVEAVGLGTKSQPYVIQ